MCKAIDIAKWFIKNSIPGLDDSFEGNMKINKLLYFAQLISLIERKQILFSDEMFAFEHGVVVENVRHEYRNNYQGLSCSALSDEIKFDYEEESILDTTTNIFGEVSAEELSELTHQHNMWKDFYKKSKINSGYNKSKSKLDVDRFFNDYSGDLNNVRSILNAYKDTNDCEDEEKCVSINNVKFYYNPSQINIDTDLMKKLEEFPADEKAYTICKDESQGVLIY